MTNWAPGIRRRHIAALLPLVLHSPVLIAQAQSTGASQTYPTKPIRWVIDGGAGGLVPAGCLTWTGRYAPDGPAVTSLFERRHPGA